MSARGGLAGAIALLVAVGCADDPTLRERAAAGQEVLVAMTATGGRTYVCLADAVGDSKPMTCPAQPGSSDFPEVTGGVAQMLVSQLDGDARFDARVVLRRTGAAWELVRYSVDGTPTPG